MVGQRKIKRDDMKTVIVLLILLVLVLLMDRLYRQYYQQLEYRFMGVITKESPSGILHTYYAFLVRDAKLEGVKPWEVVIEINQLEFVPHKDEKWHRVFWPTSNLFR